MEKGKHPCMIFAKVLPEALLKFGRPRRPPRARMEKGKRPCMIFAKVLPEALMKFGRPRRPPRARMEKGKRPCMIFAKVLPEALLKFRQPRRPLRAAMHHIHSFCRVARLLPDDVKIDVGEKTNQQAPRHPRWVSKVIMTITLDMVNLTIIIIINTVVNLMDKEWATIKPLDMVGLFLMSIVRGGMN
jgi:hypothetical protein